VTDFTKAVGNAILKKIFGPIKSPSGIGPFTEVYFANEFLVCEPTDMEKVEQIIRRSRQEVPVSKKLVLNPKIVKNRDESSILFIQNKFDAVRNKYFLNNLPHS
jgi:c-di-AMP phosphodiesterase-like protein